MNTAYAARIAALLEVLTTRYGIDPDITVQGRPPTSASSEFLTNKEQGDWAERIVLNAINTFSDDLVAVQYGRSDTLAAGDIGFSEFYTLYQTELNTIGKRPDVLVFQRSVLPNAEAFDETNDRLVSSAIAAIEVRSSSFLAMRYAEHMNARTNRATEEIRRLKALILEPPFADLLRGKSPHIFNLLSDSTEETFRDLDFRRPSWSSTEDLRTLSGMLTELKTNIKFLHRRDYLSITPKVEDIALVHKWISRFGVRHFYLQVFFDKAYIIPFESILTIMADHQKEGEVFSIERDTKNQGKVTIKINVQVGQEILGRIDMPRHESAMKELDRGRLLFYVTFKNGQGYLDEAIFREQVLNYE